MDLLMSETVFEEIVVYGIVGLVCLVIVFLYLRKQKRNSALVEAKIQKAKEEGLHEPVSLHPYVDINRCISTGACITACPEKDILGIKDGKATIINASRCIGHGACFHACPTEAISLRIGTEKRGVELPHVNASFETNIPGLYIAGELGGMGLIRNAVEQGKQAAENITRALNRNHQAMFDLVIVGAGPAGISAALCARKNNLRFVVLEQDSLGGTVFTFPRSKIVMTSPMDLPLHGKVKLFETSKTDLLHLWESVVSKHQIEIREHSRVENIVQEPNLFSVEVAGGVKLTARYVILAIGRRGTPRKLNVPGEDLEKVAYRLLEPEEISGKQVLIVGGGDSAVESALLLADRNKVHISYRGEQFSRIKPQNSTAIQEAIKQGRVEVHFLTNVLSIEKDAVILTTEGEQKTCHLPNDLVYIFAGGELPTQFLQKAGILITKKFGETLMKH
jgi:thioredoxin reductase (NADPH)